jgi:hypothetical protein
MSPIPTYLVTKPAPSILYSCSIQAMAHPCTILHPCVGCMLHLLRANMPLHKYSSNDELRNEIRPSAVQNLSYICICAEWLVRQRTICAEDVRSNLLLYPLSCAGFLKTCGSANGRVNDCGTFGCNLHELIFIAQIIFSHLPQSL